MKALTILPAFALLSLILLCGCSTTASTAKPTNTRRPPQMFPLTEEAADKLLLKAISEQYRNHPIVRVELPHKGYQTMTRFALDSDTVTAFMLPAKGRTADGEIVPGYAFQVTRSGTMVFSGTIRIINLFERIVREASEETRPLPLVE